MITYKELTLQLNTSEDELIELQNNLISKITDRDNFEIGQDDYCDNIDLSDIEEYKDIEESIEELESEIEDKENEIDEMLEELAELSKEESEGV